jgi:hypothetical protein
MPALLAYSLTHFSKKFVFSWRATTMAYGNPCRQEEFGPERIRLSGLFAISGIGGYQGHQKL